MEAELGSVGLLCECESQRGSGGAEELGERRTRSLRLSEKPGFFLLFSPLLLSEAWPFGGVPGGVPLRVVCEILGESSDPARDMSTDPAVERAAEEE